MLGGEKPHVGQQQRRRRMRFDWLGDSPVCLSCAHVLFGVFRVTDSQAANGICGKAHTIAETQRGHCGRKGWLNMPLANI